MKVQLITYNGKMEKKFSSMFTISSFGSPHSFDGFDINIISFKNSSIWYNDSNGTDTINCINDIINLGIMIRNTKKTNIVILLPNDYQYAYYKNYDGRFLHRKQLKNMLDELCGILGKMLQPISKMKLIYEPTETLVGNTKCFADFFFNQDDEYDVLLKSSHSEKTVAIKKEKIIYSTLDMSDENTIIDFFTKVSLIKDAEDSPEWMNEIKMFNDCLLLESIEESSKIIDVEKTKINIAEKELDKNNHYKSILYTQSNELVEVVFEILEEMLGFNFSNFKDLHNEDFLFETDEMAYIGEIKGVKSNVRSEYVSQLDTHYHTYLDEHPEMMEKTKSWLIINHQRKTPLFEREPVHDTQIKLAIRNESLIIDTFTLLKLFEKYKADSISRTDCLKLLSSKTGILLETDIECT